MKGEAKAGDLLRSFVASLPTSQVKPEALSKIKTPVAPSRRVSRQVPIERQIRQEKIEARRDSRAKMKAPLALDKLLKGALAKFGLDKKVDEYRFITEWRGVVGETAAAASKPEYIRNHILHVRVKSSHWAQMLSFKQDEILDKLEPLLGAGQSVSSVRFFVGEF